MFKTDLQIAQECKMEHILEVAKKAGIPEDYVDCYGKYKGKISDKYYNEIKDNPDAKLIEHVKGLDEHIMSMAGGAGTERGTGGMYAKLDAAKLVTERGIPMFIMNGQKPELIYELLDGRHVGTYFTAK